MTLRQVMMLRRVDRICGDMNRQLAPVAVMLTAATGATLAMRIAQSAAVTVVNRITSSGDLLALLGVGGW